MFFYLKAEDDDSFGHDGTDDEHKESYKRSGMALLFYLSI